MVEMLKCKCGQPGAIQDKKYKTNVLCTLCFAERRKQAAMVYDSEWFEANVPLIEMTEEERKLTGL